MLRSRALHLPTSGWGRIDVVGADVDFDEPGDRCGCLAVPDEERRSACGIQLGTLMAAGPPIDRASTPSGLRLPTRRSDHMADGWRSSW